MQPFWLFLLGCIPTRLALAFLAYRVPLRYLPWLGYMGLAIASGFLYLYFTGKRRVGVETGGAPIWWRPYRLLHGSLYLLFGLLAVAQIRAAYAVVLVDTLIGLGLFLRKHGVV